MADFIFLLWHEFEVEDEEITTLLGVFRSRQLAEENQRYFETQPGFKDYLDGFEIVETPLDKRLWSEGFILYNKTLEAME